MREKNGAVEAKEDIRIYWANVLQIKGIGYGYTMHQQNLRKALEGLGAKIQETPDGADVAVTITPAGNYQPVEGLPNVLYTMYECVDIPQSWIPKVNQADLIVVPCTYNKRLFKKYTKKPIEVCWEGVHTDIFTYKKREKKSPFVYLWVGASNERKGYVHTIVAWTEFNRRYPEIAKNCQLIMKTTQLSGSTKRIIGYKEGKPIYAEMPNERVFRAENAIVDTRDLPVEMMAKMYHYANCFLFPTMGEGFGLTLAEAMATGLPCIYTPWSGPVDFISPAEGYPLKWKFTKIKAMTPQDGGTWRVDLESYAASAEIDSIVQRMVQVYEDYDTALEKGRRAAERIRRDITWPKSAERFLEIVGGFLGRKDHSNDKVQCEV